MVESTTKPFSISEFFANPNMQLLLAGLGTELDPEGAGGRIGRPTANLIRSQAAQSAAAKQLAEGKAERDELRNQHRELMNRLGPITPIDRPGLNSIKPASNGTVNIDTNTNDSGKLVSDLNGFTPLEQEGVNSVTRSPSGSMLVNYTLPKPRTVPSVSDEVTSLAAAPTASRDTSRLSYTPASAAATQADIDSTLGDYYGRRRLV